MFRSKILSSSSSNISSSNNQITELNNAEKKLVQSIITAIEANLSNNSYSNLVGFLKGSIALENLGIDPAAVKLIKDNYPQYFETSILNNTLLKKALAEYFLRIIPQNNSQSLFKDSNIIDKIKQNISDVSDAIGFSNYYDNYEAGTSLNPIDKLIEIVTPYLNKNDQTNHHNLSIEDFSGMVISWLTLPIEDKLKLINEFNNILRNPGYSPQPLLDMLEDLKQHELATVADKAKAELRPGAKKEDIIKLNSRLEKMCNLLGIKNPSLEKNNPTTDQKVAFKEYLFNHFLSNDAKAALNIPKLINILNFEEVFKEETGISFAQFMGMIYGAPIFQLNFAAASSIRPSKIPYQNKKIVNENQSKELTQLIKINDYLTALTKIEGFKTFSSNSQILDPDLFKKNPNVLGINHNLRITTILTDDGNLPEYKLHTLGSYQIDTPDSVSNATTLIQKFFSKGDIVVDFKPLKRLYNGDQDIKVFKTHISVMGKAVKTSEITYLPIWGNSYSIAIMGSPESNNKFMQITAELSEKLNLVPPENQEKLGPLLTKLSSLTSNLNNFTKRGTFQLIFSLTRILVAHIPDHKIKLIGGCMSAKDRMQSLTYASEVIITMYHKKGNLDFINDDGRLIADKLQPDDFTLLKVLINNKIGQNYLSLMGIGVLNNKNLNLFANLFASIPELFNMIDQRSYVKTSV